MSSGYNSARRNTSAALAVGKQPGMPEETFEQVKPNLYRFTIREEPPWDDPSHGYRLELIVAFLEDGENGQLRLWYSHHEHYSRLEQLCQFMDPGS
jgi:hypothetical protein